MDAGSMKNRERVDGPTGPRFTGKNITTDNEGLSVVIAENLPYIFHLETGLSAPRPKTCAGS
jgi:hypothetical protein